MSQGGGTIVIPVGIDPEYTIRNLNYDPQAVALQQPGVLVEDYRRPGHVRSIVPSGGVHNNHHTVIGGVHLERDLVDDVRGTQAGAVMCISNRIRAGTNSVSDIIKKDVKVNDLVRFYPQNGTVSGLAVGNWINFEGRLGNPYKIVSLGLDSATNEPYFTVAYTADLEPIGSTSPANERRFHNKVWCPSIDLEEFHNANSQSATLSLTRKTYGNGDQFGISSILQYASDIRSSGGDEGAVGVSVNVLQDLDTFQGVVEKWDADKFELTYKPTNCINFWKIGTGRPIINMNNRTWKQDDGFVIVKGGGLFFGTSDCQWDDSIVGKFITINEPSEYYSTANTEDQKSLWAVMSVNGPERIVRRWFLIQGVNRQSDGTFALKVLGTHTPLNHQNLGTKLRYIIAPGSFVTDVRDALPTGIFNDPAGLLNSPRIIRLAPFPNASDAFKELELIEQPAGASPQIPTGYRNRNINFFPGITGSSYTAENNGPTSMGTGLWVTSYANLQSKDDMPKFSCGVLVSASNSKGLVISGPSLESAISLENSTKNAINITGPCSNYGIAMSGSAISSFLIGGQYTQYGLLIQTPDDPMKPHTAAIGLSQIEGGVKKIRWIGKGAQWNSNIYANETTGDLMFEKISVGAPTKNINLSRSKVTVQVPAGATEWKVTGIHEGSNSYAVFVDCDWFVRTKVVGKTLTEFTIVFDVAPQANGILSWFIVD